MNVIGAFFTEVYHLFLDMAPYLLLGLTVAGALSVLFTKAFVAKHVGRPGFAAITKAALLGVPLPLCSCGVVPTATYLGRSGASKPAVMSFLISTPQTGVDSIAATYGMLGPLFALLRPIIALVTGLAGGVVSWLAGEKTPQPVTTQSVSIAEEPRAPLGKRIRDGMGYAYVETVDDIAVHFVVGLLIAGLITLVIPADFFDGRVIGSGLPAMLIMVVVGIPMYICSTSSIPIAVALIAKGLSPGAAYVFLVAGPATNAASLAVLSTVLGRRDTIIYVASIVVGALAFGPIVDALTRAVGWTLPGTMAGAAHSEVVGWLGYGSGIALGGLIIAALWRKLWPKIRGKSKQGITWEDSVAELKLKVEGMTCNHCASTVENAVAGVAGVDEVHVDLDAKIVSFNGSAEMSAVADAVKEAGYQPVP